MSWFSKAGIYEKLALYCIDKSPLVVDKEKLKSKDGKIIVTDARINHKFADENRNKQDSSENGGFNEIDGIIRHIDVEITSNGLTINVEDCEAIVHDTNQSSLDVNRITEDLMKSVHLLKNNFNTFNYREFGNSIYASSSESETSVDSINIKKEPLYNDDIMTNEENNLGDDFDAQHSSVSLLDSFKNKIIDMILSNFHIQFSDVRVILVNSEIVVNIESFEAKSSGSERYIDVFGVGVEKYYEDKLAMRSPVDNSIFVSARSSFTNSKAQNLKDGLSDEGKYIMYLEEISLYFISSNDPSKLMPEEVMISDFSVKYDDKIMSFSSFNIFVKKSIHRYIFKTDELIVKITAINLDSKGYKLELNNIEYSNYMKAKLKNGESLSSDTFEIEKIKIFHKNMNLSSKKSSSSHKALSVAMNRYSENEKAFGFDFKVIALEMVLKTYRINTGIIIKIPLITGSWKNSKLTGVIKTFSFSLIESFKTLNILNNFLVVDNVRLVYEGSYLSVEVAEANSDLCADSLNCFIQTMTDIFYTETYPAKLKYKFETNELLDLSDILASSDYFIPEKFDGDNKSHSGSICIEKEKPVNVKMKKRFLKGFIEKVLLEKEKCGSIEGFPINLNPSNSKFKLSLLIKALTLKMHEGFNFNHTRNTIALKLKQLSDSDRDDVLFNSIYIPKNHKQNTTAENEYLETQLYNTLPEFNLQKVKTHSGEIKATDLSVDFELINQIIQSKLQLRCKDLDVIDNLKSSDFNKFLTSHKSPELDNSFSKEKRKLLSFDLEIVKPDGSLLATEMRMKLCLEPIRMHINEEYIDFLMRFFTFRDERFELIDEYPERAYIQKLEIMGINISVDFKSGVKKSKEDKDVNEEESVRSKFLSTLKSLIVVENCDLKFKHLVMYGIDDFGDISKIIQSRWIMDVINSQRIALMSGVLPLNSALNITTAFKNLIEQPFVQSSTMDVSRSLQNNLIDLGKVSGKEFLKFGVSLSQHTQKWLENTEALLSDSNVNLKDKYIDVKKEYYASEDNIIGQRGRQNETERLPNAQESDNDQALKGENKPSTFKEGLNLALSSLENNLGDAYKTVSNTSKDLQKTRNKKDASKMVMNNLGITLLKPLIGATGALNNGFQGLQGELQDDEVNYYTRLYLKEKYK